MNAINTAWRTAKLRVRRFSFWRGLRSYHKALATLLHDALLRQLTRRRPPIGLPVLLAVVLTAVAWSASSASAEPEKCFRYGEVVTLSGRYFADVAATDDGVVRDARTDTARRTTLLSLTTPFCVDADTISRGIAVAATVQLNCPAVHPADGTELSIEGRLIGAHSGNGQTPVLLMCP